MNESCGNIQFFYSGNPDQPVYFRIGALWIADQCEQPLQFRSALVSGFPSVVFFMRRNGSHAVLFPDPFSTLVEIYARFVFCFFGFAVAVAADGISDQQYAGVVSFG